MDADSKLAVTWLVGERKLNDCWTFIEDLKGSIVHLGRSFRQAHDEVTQAGDNDIYLHNPRIMANDLCNLGVLTPD